MDWSSLRPKIARSTGPIGLEIQEDQIRLAQLDLIQGVPVIRDIACLRLVSGAEAFFEDAPSARRSVTESLRRGRFKGSHIVSHVPASLLRLMVLNYTADEDLSEAAQILDLTQERVRGDLSEYVVDYVPIRTSGSEQTGERSALVAIAPEQPVIEHLERLRRIGLKVDALEIAPVSIRRLVALPHSTGEEIVLVLRMLRTSTELTVLSGKRLLLFREVPGGYEAILSAAAKSMECDEATAHDLLQSYGVRCEGAANAAALAATSEEVVDDLRTAAEGIVNTLRETIRPALRLVVDQAHKAISYAAFQTRGSTLDKILVLDGQQTCIGLDDLLGEMLQLPVELFDPALYLEPDRDAPSQPRVREAAIAIGMSLRGLGDA